MRKIAIIVLGLVGIILGITYFYWLQATALPDWYAPLSNQPSDSIHTTSPPIGKVGKVTSSRPAATITKKIQAAPPGPFQEQLSAAEIDNLIVAGLSQTKKDSKNRQVLPPAVKAVKTQIQQNRIETGAVLDLGKLAQLPPSDGTKSLRKILQILPQLQDRQVYVGVSGQLTVKNQQLHFSPESKLQIGKVEFGLDEAAQRIGVKRAQLDEQLTRYLRLPSLKIQQIDLTDRGAVITGIKK